MNFNKLFKSELGTLKTRFEECSRAHEQFKSPRNENGQELKWNEYKRSERYERYLSDYKAAHRIANSRVEEVLSLENWNDYDLAHALAYLAMPIKIFRSGYTKERLCRRLRKEKISDEQAQVLEGLLVEQVHIAGREFKGMLTLFELVNQARFLEVLNSASLPKSKYVENRIQRIRAKVR